MKMGKLVVAVVAFVLVASFAGVASAEEFRSPVLFASDVNFDNGAVVKIHNVQMTATAAQLNTTAGVGTMTPSNVLMTGTMTTTPTPVSSVTNGQTVTITSMMNLVLSVGAAANLTNTITLANPSAAGQWAMLYNQKTATNVLGIASSGNFHGPAVSIAAGEGVLLFAPTATNWAGIGQ